MKKTSYINIKIPYELKRALKVKATLQDMSISEAIRKIIQEYVKA